MNKRRTPRPRPTFAQVADSVRQEVVAEFQERLAAEEQAILEEARVEYEHAYNLLAKHATALEQENALLREQLRNAQDSWLTALGSRVKRLWS
jgi:predicted nuclease with TOPRIM domain